jgi:hypothetical protein
MKNLKTQATVALGGALCSFLLSLSSAICADGDAADAKERAARLAEMKRQAADYSLTLEGKSQVPLVLHDEAVLRFNNPVGGVPDGIVVLWKHGKRPAVFAQVFQTKEGLWIHECQSLASAGLKMQSGEKTFWSPGEGAESFRRLVEAPPAADTPARRLAQMKQLAAEFSATDDFKISSRDVETTRHALRILPTPVYRYDDPALGVTDAAVFAFVQGTDPEVFLVLEHRSSKDEKAGWHYTLAPMTCWAVEVKHKGDVVWSAPNRQGKSKLDHLYHVWVHRPK